MLREDGGPSARPSSWSSAARAGGRSWLIACAARVSRYEGLTVWTPKRLVLLASGFAVFFSAYFGYALSFLGGIDGLPPLPSLYWRDDKDRPKLPPVGPRTNKLEAKFRVAFGEDCPELNRPIRFELQSKSMALAADQFQIEPDGRVCLSPVSMAL